MAGTGLDTKFLNKVTSVATHADATGRGMINEGQVVWDTLADGGTTDPGADRFLTSFRTEFQRKGLSDEYIRLNSTISTGQQDIKTRVSEVSLVRAQYDWLMQVERDFLFRRRTRIRAEAHAAAVREMTGDDYGPVLNGILRVSRQMMARAGETENG